jgi:hypothetical protein
MGHSFRSMRQSHGPIMPENGARKAKRDQRVKGGHIDKVSVDPTERVGYASTAKTLRDLADRTDIPASARVTAARTLAEIEGLIGRHQQSPDRAAIAPVSSLSRADLVTELERLRYVFAHQLRT